MHLPRERNPSVSRSAAYIPLPNAGRQPAWISGASAGLGCHADRQLAEVGLIGCGAVKARMRPHFVVQEGLRTPTGPFSENCLSLASVVRDGGGDPRVGRQGRWCRLRCTLSGSAADRWLEVPAWMFDRARCLDLPRLTASPFVSKDALSVLSDLLRQASLSSSNAPHSGASSSSHDQNWGEAHDHAKAATTASDAGRTAKASAKRPFPADRPVSTA